MKLEPRLLPLGDEAGMTQIRFGSWLDTPENSFEVGRITGFNLSILRFPVPDYTQNFKLIDEYMIRRNN